MGIKGISIKNGKLPENPGVYLMKDASGRLLYVGKAVNLKRRVESYFSRPHDARIEKMVSEIRRIDYEPTPTAIEALMREAELIKKLEPPYNVREKDDKSFLFVVVTKEQYPRVLLVRGKDVRVRGAYGPFTSAKSLREALRILRRIFPWNTHPPEMLARHMNSASHTKACFDFELGLCPGTCIGAADKKEYRKNIARLKLFFAGKRDRIVAGLERDMNAASKRLDFETAEKMRRQLFALQHIQDVALVSEDEVRDTRSAMPNAHRIEGYDISNISGDAAVGSMVVFVQGKPDKNEYRKFKIRSRSGPDDTGMLKEVLERRVRHDEWPRPDLILVDGGAPQVSAARAALRAHGWRVPVIGIAKGPERKRNDVIGLVPAGFTKTTLIRVRDEAHRFAITYHKRLRSKRFLGEE